MHQRVLTEHILDRAVQRLPAVDDEQDRLLGIKTTLNEVGQQRPGERGVLGRALPQSERDLHSLGADPERDDVGALGDLEPVEHHHREAHVIQPAAHQLPQRGPRPLDEPLRDRALACRCARLLNLLADRLPHALKPARGDAREHPVHHRPCERVAVGEVPVCRERQLPLVIGAPHTRPVDLHAPPA